MVSSVAAAFGGILSTSRITHSDIAMGSGLEITMLTACVIGGCSLSGGKGSVLPAFTGLLFLSALSNGMVIYKIDPYVQEVLNGLILILAVFVAVQMDKKRTGRTAK